MAFAIQAPSNIQQGRPSGAVNLWNWTVDVYLTFDLTMYGYRSIPDEVTGTPAQPAEAKTTVVEPPATPKPEPVALELPA